jgi:hypothetical protein
MKACSKCGVVSDNFGNDSSKPDHLNHWCRECCRISSRNYYFLNREAKNESSRKYMQAHPEKRLEYFRRWLEKDNNRMIHNKRNSECQSKRRINANKTNKAK